jgi:hypothetical protein
LAKVVVDEDDEDESHEVAAAESLPPPHDERKPELLPVAKLANESCKKQNFYYIIFKRKIIYNL